MLDRYESDEAFVRKLGIMYEKVMALRKDEDYVIDQTQMDRFLDLVSFFIDICEKSNGKLEPIEVVPKEEQGDISASFVVFDIIGDDVKRFSDVIRYCSCVGVDSYEDGRICIECKVPNIFKHK